MANIPSKQIKYVVSVLTYQSIKHLVQNCPKAPPVHSPVIRLLVKDFRGKVLLDTNERMGTFD